MTSIGIGIGIGIGDTGPVFTWYRIDTKICSIAHPYFERPCETIQLFISLPKRHSREQKRRVTLIRPVWKERHFTVAYC